MTQLVIKPLNIKNTIFPVNLIQGPLAGISCAPFRLLAWQYSQPAFSSTEMISCKTLIHHHKAKLIRFIKKDPQEGPVSFQLSGNDPKELGLATRLATDYGADLIDLNCGCPVNKIRKKGAGSRLLTEPALLYQLITAMKQNTHLPVSIKIRVEGGSGEQFNQMVANVVSDAGADFLVVHGRHWTEHYETPCHYQDIQFFVDALKIPVIGNGDVACKTSLLNMFATGCAGVMIGRAGVGQPWLIKKLIAEIKNETFTPPSLSEIRNVFLFHVEQLIELLGSEKFAILQSRKFLKYYARGAEKTLIAKINTCETFAGLQKLCLAYL